MAGYDLKLAFRYACMWGIDASSAMEMWSQETVLRKAYTGFEVASRQRASSALIKLGLAFILSCKLWSLIVINRRNKRVLSALVDSGAVSKEQVN